MTSGARVFQLPNPPVRAVSLKIALEATPRLEGWHLDEFFSSLRSEKFTRREVAPTVRDQNEEAYEFLNPEDAWPIPRTILDFGDRSLSVQGDELEVTWKFGASTGESAYPGYESLRARLDDLFQKLLGSTKRAGVEVSARGVECFYENEITELSTKNLAIGVLTNWKFAAENEDGQEGYVGVRMHDCADRTAHNCASLVMVDAMVDEKSALSFKVSRRVDENESAIAALEAAHDELIALFRRHTSDKLRAGWGEK